MHFVLPVTDHELCSQKPSGNLYWKSIFFGKKKNINYQIKFTLNLINLYQSLFYSWNETRDPGKCLFGEMSFWGIALSRNCPLGSVRELSIGEMSSGNCPSGKSPLGKSPWGNCPDTEGSKTVPLDTEI